MSSSGSLAVPLRTIPSRWEVVDQLLALLFQTDCVICGELAPEGRFCLPGHSLQLLPETQCLWCGRETPKKVIRCGQCHQRKNRTPFANRSLFAFDDVARALVHKIKYRSLVELSHHFLSTFAQWRPWSDLEEFSLVAVPLHPRKLWERGFNLSEILVWQLAKASGMKVETGLIRVEEGKTQAKLKRTEREENLKNAFAWVGPPPASKVILVDDIFTTGATLAACGAILLREKTKEVRTLTAFRTPFEI